MRIGMKVSAALLLTSLGASSAIVCKDASKSQTTTRGKGKKRVHLEDIVRTYSAEMHPAVRQITGAQNYWITKVEDLSGREAWFAEACEAEPSPQNFFAGKYPELSQRFYWKSRTANNSALLNLGLVAAVNELIKLGVEPYVNVSTSKGSEEVQVPVLFASAYSVKIPENYRNPLLVFYKEIEDNDLISYAHRSIKENGEATYTVRNINTRTIALMVTASDKATLKDYERIKSIANIPTKGKQPDAKSGSEKELILVTYDLGAAQYDKFEFLNGFPCCKDILRRTKSVRNKLIALKIYSEEKVRNYKSIVKEHFGEDNLKVWKTAIKNTVDKVVSSN
eukprot:TRINITY_DN122943_c0_g1_i1.p1 TRINITY_DN122943_c0_g1~~TRINITY_DN122943_c0_g1_i1.p1  ORF type:complete len:337 (+),score=27.40 TRINITY_DN122943_c0_g1_i1:90-1100(+)